MAIDNVAPGNAQGQGQRQPKSMVFLQRCSGNESQIPRFMGNDEGAALGLGAPPRIDSET